MKRFLVGFFALMLAGCASGDLHLGTQNVVYQGMAFPQQLCRGQFSQTKLLTFDYEGKVDQVLAVVECKNNTFDLIGLTATGIRLFSLQVQAGQIRVKTQVELPKPDLPYQVLWDYLFSELPTSELTHIMTAEYGLSEEGGKKRLKTSSGEVVAVLTPLDDGTVRLDKPKMRYRIDIERID